MEAAADLTVKVSLTFRKQRGLTVFEFRALNDYRRKENYEPRVPVLIFALMTSSLLSGFSISAEEPTRNQGQDLKVVALKKERLETLRKVEELFVLRVRSGDANMDDVWRAKRQVADAELDLCTSEKERIAILEKLLNEAKGVESRVAQAYKSGGMQEDAALKAKADRIEVEILLEKAKANVANASK